MIRFVAEPGGPGVVLDLSVVERLAAHRQLRPGALEAGGQLFGRIDGLDALVLEATGPRATDRRGPVHYLPDRAAERCEIAERYARGLHFVGDWHTHSEMHPRPSATDLASMGDCVRRSIHGLAAFLLVIQGCAPGLNGLSVTLHDGCTARPLIPDPVRHGVAAKVRRGPGLGRSVLRSDG